MDKYEWEKSDADKIKEATRTINEMLELIGKIKLENEENMSWYYLCPRNIPVRVNWSPYHININYKN